MHIQFNSGNNVAYNKEFKESLILLISDELNRFEDFITRLEIHLSDEDGKKNGQKDKRCLIEARFKGLQPIAVSDEADTHEFAVIGAVGKLKSSLNTISGRKKNY